MQFHSVPVLDSLQSPAKTKKAPLQLTVVLVSRQLSLTAVITTRVLGYYTTGFNHNLYEPPPCRTVVVWFTLGHQALSLSGKMKGNGIFYDRSPLFVRSFVEKYT